MVDVGGVCVGQREKGRVEAQEVYRTGSASEGSAKTVLSRLTTELMMQLVVCEVEQKPLNDGNASESNW